MKEELRKEIVQELANGSKISAATLRRWMRKHSMSREGLWKCVREVEGGTAKAITKPTTNKEDEALAQILDPERQKILADLMDFNAAAFDDGGKHVPLDEAPEQVHQKIWDTPQFDNVIESVEKLPRPITHFRNVNPFLLLKVQRAYKREFGNTPTREYLLELQKTIVDASGETTIPQELAEKILSL